MTSPSTLVRSGGPADGFRHEALLYRGDDGFVAATVPFIRGAVAAGEPILVVVAAYKIALLRAALGTGADRVLFADMAHVGANPARIIPAWVDFVAEYGAGGRPVRGIGEPIDTTRSSPELVECSHHEALLNVAFEQALPFWLACPYDTDALEPSIVEEAHRNHPFVRVGDDARPSYDFRDPIEARVPFEGPFPPPPPTAPQLAFGLGRLDRLRDFVAEVARAAGLARPRIEDLVLAVNELATNSLRYGGGGGTLSVWHDDEAFVCEVRDRGCIDHPLIGRQKPPAERLGGRGLWLVNQLCDLVQIRSSPEGTAVRCFIWRR